MKTSQDPVRDYLSAVEREASALPADRRQELLADLAEHIEVTRAERPDAVIGEILAELGDPRTIAATALAESGSPAAPAPAPAWGGADDSVRRGKVHPLVPLLLLVLAQPAGMVFPDEGGSLIGGLLRITGAVLLCTSVHWTAGRKTVGVLLTFALPGVAMAVWNLADGGPTGAGPALAANLAALVLTAGTAAWLWRVRRA
ncbi:HAAS signaling domain-containing protein [Streptomyces cyaneofuscatus]|uniref:HAAS signaling domain-containing protein n=1 Tax=Streptomyces cyaneofuscatus TaxID=66883 RepID=UPI0037A8C1EF